MISCHSSAGRASQGGHARLTGRSAGSHCRGRAGVSWGGSRGGTRSHEPPQWALQGVLGAPLPTGGFLALWGYPGVPGGGVSVGARLSRPSLPMRPSLLLPAPCRLTATWGERLEAGVGPEVHPLPTALL